jgi:uncharacterized protein (TIGR02246 family)
MSIRDEVQARNDVFGQAADRGDAAGLASLYTEDAWLLPPGAPMVRGRPGIETFCTQRLERIASIRLTAIDVAQFGDDDAREVGRSELVLKGQSEAIRGKYVVTWKRVGGVWHLEADAFDSDG